MSRQKSSDETLPDVHKEIWHLLCVPSSIYLLGICDASPVACPDDRELIYRN